MNREKPRRQLIDVDALQEALSVEQVARHYGFALPEGFASGGEQRMRCPCAACQGSQDDRSVSINTSDPAKRWKCHRDGYGCGAAGNLVTLAYVMKHGAMPAGGKPTGKEFYAIAQDLQAIGGDEPSSRRETSEDSHAEVQPNVAKQAVAKQQQETNADVAAVLHDTPNVPLAESDNENSRKLDRLDDKLIVKLADLPAPASRYARRRRFLLDEDLARECRFGYLPNTERSMVRGKWVYGVMDEEGRPLAWIGRNLSVDDDSTQAPSGGKQADDAKYRFPRQEYFRRGLELYGQEFLTDERFAESLQRHGLILVEGFTDRIRLHQLGVMAVAMMSNTLTDEQTEKLVRFAKDNAGNRVGIMHDNDTPGVQGAKESLWRLHEAGVDAYLVWSPKTHDGKFKDRQPEELTERELKDLFDRGDANT